jgi:hypothetical protein
MIARWTGKFRVFACGQIVAAVMMLVAPVGQAQTSEPPQKFSLEVDGAPREIRPGEVIEIEATGTVKLKLSVAPHRLFEYGGVRFEYPSAFGFEAEIDEASASWTLDGNSVVLILLEIPETEMSHEEMAQSIAENYEDPAIESCAFEFGETRCDGTRITAELAAQRMSQEVYAIPSENGVRFLIVQDSLDEAGGHSAEHAQTTRILGETFRIVETAAKLYKK